MKGNVKITYPTSWEDVTVEKYVKMQKVLSDYNNKENKTELDNFQLLTNTFYAATGMTEDEVAQIDYKKFLEICHEIMDIVKKPVEQRQDIDFVEIDGEKYYPRDNFDELNIFETQQLNNLIERDPTLMTVLDEMLCLLIFKKEDGVLEKFKPSMMKRKDIMSKAIITHVNDLFLFFYNGVMESQKDSQKSLNKKK